MRIQISPSFDALYYSPYILGLRRSFGASSFSFSGAQIPDFGHHGLAAITENDGGEHRIFISASDGSGINQRALKWADVFAKVNLDPSHEIADRNNKLLAIGPSFPVKIWGSTSAIARGLANFVACKGRVGSLRRHFGPYRAQWLYRVSEAEYRPSQAAENYVFFASRLWAKESQTNSFRANFIRAGRDTDGIQFEGGFVPRQQGSVAGFDDLSTDSSFSIRAYLGGIKRSVVAFNTPAVSGCHGWKLAEYLALGKAIITTPFLRCLPSPLRDGVHVHVVDGSVASIRSAIQHIRADRSYRSMLERNARAYYEEFLAPEAVIQRVVAFANGSVSNSDDDKVDIV